VLHAPAEIAGQASALAGALRGLPLTLLVPEVGVEPT